MIVPSKNPYNLGVPITHEWQFAGREKELEQIVDCLRQVIGGNRINVAIVSEPGMGKTSLLNIVELRARTMGVLPLRINFRSEMVENELLFFREVYHTVILEGAKLGMFQMYENQVNSVINQLECARVSSENVIELPLRFPKMFVECMTTNTNLPVTRAMLKSDLEFIISEARRINYPAIAIFVDDCDHMTVAILEKLKGLFTEVEGFFVCLAGSGKMLQTWREVVSSMPRLFLTINLQPFSNEADTRRCVRKPLQKAEYREIEVAYELFKELHALTSGNPYEIQMLCYLMYQQVAKGESEELTLNPAVLEAMVKQFEFQRPAVSDEIAFQKATQRLSEEDLELASELLEFEGMTSQEEAVCKLAFQKQTSRQLKKQGEAVQINRQKLSGLNIVELQEDTFYFRTGIFGKIYLKYFYESTTKRPQRTPRLISTMPNTFEGFLLSEFVNQLTNSLNTSREQPSPLWFPYPATDSESVKVLIDSFCRSVWENDFNALLSSELFMPVVLIGSRKEGDAKDYLIILLEISCRGRASIPLLFTSEILDNKQKGEDSKDEFMRILDNYVESAREYGIMLERVEYELLPSEVAESSRNLWGLFQKTSTSTLETGQAIIEDDLESALHHINEENKLVQNLKGNVIADAKNNLGFVELCSGDFDDALEHVKESLNIREAPIPLINLAYIYACIADEKDDPAARLDAEEAAKKAVEMLSSDPTLTAWLLKVYMPPIEVLSFDDSTQSLVENPVMDSIARCTLASLLAMRNEFPEALRNCDLAERRSSDRAYPLRIKARVLLSNGEIEKAIDVMKRAAEVEPSDTWAIIEYEKLRHSI